MAFGGGFEGALSSQMSSCEGLSSNVPVLSRKGAVIAPEDEENVTALALLGRLGKGTE